MDNLPAHRENQCLKISMFEKFIAKIKLTTILNMGISLFSKSSSKIVVGYSRAVLGFFKAHAWGQFDLVQKNIGDEKITFVWVFVLISAKRLSLHDLFSRGIGIFYFTNFFS